MTSPVLRRDPPENRRSPVLAAVVALSMSAGASTAMAQVVQVAAGDARALGAPKTIPAASASASAGQPRYRPSRELLATGPARVKGSRVRGSADEALSITVIAPDHVGLTTMAQPTLYWHASSPIRGAVAITVQDESSDAPALEARVELDGARGMIAVPLQALGVRLATGAEYRWSVAVLEDEDNPSRNVVTSGYVRRVSAPARAENDEPAALAQSGYWYDAISALGERIGREPAQPQWHRQRAALLDQVGLAEAARDDTVAAQAGAPSRSPSR